MWLTLDDANLGNGGMKMYNFSAMPETRENNLPMRDIKGIDDTKEQFGAFFQGEQLQTSKAHAIGEVTSYF